MTIWQEKQNDNWLAFRIWYVYFQPKMRFTRPMSPSSYGSSGPTYVASGPISSGLPKGVLQGRLPGPLFATGYCSRRVHVRGMITNTPSGFWGRTILKACKDSWIEGFPIRTTWFQWIFQCQVRSLEAWKWRCSQWKWRYERRSRVEPSKNIL